jgi:hypothetical protein
MRVRCVDVRARQELMAPGEFMQQRRVRLGDILDDYCPRERRITNHAVVAMIEDEVKQTRCTTCDAEHEYKQAKVPAPRKKKPGTAALVAAPVAETADAASFAPASFAPPQPVTLDEVFDAPPSAEPFAGTPDSVAVAAAAADDPPVSETDPPAAEDEWPVHRPLIRATLPRPEGQTPERKEPEFTIRQNGRFDRNGNRHRAKGHGRGGQGGSGHARFNQHSGSGQSRSGSGHGHGAGQHSGQGSRHGNRPHAGQRGGRHGGQGRGPNSGQGRGRRGR